MPGSTKIDRKGATQQEIARLDNMMTRIKAASELRRPQRITIWNTCKLARMVLATTFATVGEKQYAQSVLQAWET